MMFWSLQVGAFVAGCILLAWGAGRFIKGSVAIAARYQVPPFIIGMVLVGFGTSCPEWAVATLAAMKHTSGLAIGSVFGSNIANQALVGGVAALLLPLTFHSRVLFREFPFLIAVTVLVGMMCYTGTLTVTDGIILLILFVGYMWRLLRIARQSSRDDTLIVEVEHEVPQISISVAQALLWIAVGFVALLGGAEIMVHSATQVAFRLGLSNLIIGLTVVAIGTSLPELAATVISCLREEHDLAIGNVIGSSLFNLLAVLPMPALIDPGHLNPDIMRRDYPALLLITLLFWLLAVLPPRRKRIGRVGGSVLLLAYVAYIGILAIPSWL